MSMARLWRDQGKPRQARELLAPVYVRPSPQSKGRTNSCRQLQARPQVAAALEHHLPPIGWPTIYVAKSMVCGTAPNAPIRSAQESVVNDRDILAGTDAISVQDRWDGCHLGQSGLDKSARLWFAVITSGKDETGDIPGNTLYPRLRRWRDRGEATHDRCIFAGGKQWRSTVFAGPRSETSLGLNGITGCHG